MGKNTGTQGKGHDDARHGLRRRPYELQDQARRLRVVLEVQGVGTTKTSSIAATWFLELAS